METIKAVINLVNVEQYFEVYLCLNYHIVLGSPYNRPSVLIGGGGNSNIKLDEHDN